MVKLINKEENSQPEQIVDLNPCPSLPLHRRQKTPTDA